jgi:hypothetical protein
VPGDGLVDILLFDNGIFRGLETSGSGTQVQLYSRVVHYRINEASMTVEQVWEYGKARGAAIFSKTVGSADRLPNGNVLGTWGNIVRDSKGNPQSKSGPSDTISLKMIEVDPRTKQVVFETSVPGVMDYRSLRAGFYAGYSENNNFLSSALNDTSTNDLLDRIHLASRDPDRWRYSPNILVELKRIARHILGLIR